MLGRLVPKLKLTFTLVAVAGLVMASPAAAINGALRQAINYGAVWYDASGGCNYGTIAGGSQTGVWNSGQTPPYILQQFMIEVLKDIASKTGKSAADAVTPEHVLALVSMALGEGGDINNDDLFNPLNTGINAPDLISGTHAGNGVQSFKSFDAGVEATARALSDPNHTRLSAALTNPNSTAEDFMYALTYFQKYPGNAIWAEASLPPNQDNYYHREIGFVQTTRSQYPNIAGLVIGTPAKEQLENLTDLAKLDQSLAPSGSNNIPRPSNDISTSGGGCGQGGGSTP